MSEGGNKKNRLFQNHTEVGDSPSFEKAEAIRRPNSPESNKGRRKGKG